MTTQKLAARRLLLLPGDGIGPEVVAEVKRLIEWMNQRGLGRFETEDALVGGCCYDAHGVAITDATMEKARAADAVIFGAVGGPKWDHVPYEACCGCARSSRCLPISGPRFAIRRSRSHRV